MTMLTVTAEQQPTPHQVAAADRSAPRKVTGKLKRALDLIAWEAKTDNEAAVAVGMHVLSIRKALNRPHVRAYLRAQRDVLLTREIGRNISTLIDVRDQTSNQMARVQAVKALEQLEDSPTSSSSRMQAPGFVIVVQAGPAPVVDHRPTNAANIRTIEHEQHQEHE